MTKTAFLRLPLLVALAAAPPGVALADTPIALSQLPAAVTKTLVDYFPGSRNLSAQRDGDDAERARYKVKLRYRAITIEVDLTPQGRITDIDMDDRAPR